MSRPLIGLTAYAERSQFGINDTYAAVLPMAYVHAIHASGGRAVLITTDDPGVDVLDDLDGVLFTGGSDLDPALYGAEPHPMTTGVRPERDAAELILMRGALAADLPLLGVCRGMQLMCVVYGGTLHQHLPDLLGHQGHRPAGGPKSGKHPVVLEPGTICHRLLGDSVVVNSSHHQGCKDPGELIASGWCPEDQLVETVEDPDKHFTIGVQWHPEDTADFRVFEALVAAARERRLSREPAVLTAAVSRVVSRGINLEIGTP